MMADYSHSRTRIGFITADLLLPFFKLFIIMAVTLIFSQKGSAEQSPSFQSRGSSKGLFSITPAIGAGGMIQDVPDRSSANLIMSLSAAYGVADWLKINGDVTTQVFNSTYIWVSPDRSNFSLYVDQGMEEITWVHASADLRLVHAQYADVWFNPGYAYLWSTYYNYYLSGPSLGASAYTHMFNRFNPEISVDVVYGASTRMAVSPGAEVAGGRPEWLTSYTVAIPVFEAAGFVGRPVLYVGYSGSALTYVSYTRYFNNLIIASRFIW